MIYIHERKGVERMDLFLHYFKTTFIDDIRCTFFPHYILDDLTEFTDEKDKLLSLHVHFQHPKNKALRLWFSITINESHFVHLRLRTAKKVKSIFIDKMCGFILQKAEQFEINGFVSIFSFHSRYESPLIPTSDLAKKAVSLMDVISSSSIQGNHQYFEMVHKEKIIQHRSYFYISFEEQVQLCLYVLERDDKSNCFSRKTFCRLTSQEDILLFEDEIANRIKFALTIRNQLFEYTLSTFAESAVIDENLHLFGQGLGVRIEIVANEYELIVFGKRFRFTDSEEAVSQGKEMIAKEYHLRRLRHLFRS